MDSFDTVQGDRDEMSITPLQRIVQILTSIAKEVESENEEKSEGNSISWLVSEPN